MGPNTILEDLNKKHILIILIAWAIGMSIGLGVILIDMLGLF